ncbi:hypothetical protein D3C75_974090 [compost metagenome]
MHFLTGNSVAFKRRFFKVLEYQLDCFNCQTISVVTRHNRYISFDGMCQYVHTCISYSSFWQAIYELWINDSYVWS